MAKQKATASTDASKALPLLLYQGLCNPFECDHYGHMNVRHYLSIAHKSCIAFAAAAKLDRAFSRESTSTIVLRDAHIRFHAEVRAGDLTRVTGGVVASTDETAVLHLELRRINHDNSLAATFRVAFDHVDAKRTVSFPWSKKAREAIAALTIDSVPNYAQPKSIDLSASAEAGSLAKAQELGVSVCGLSPLMLADCDAFERMLPEMFLAKQSDAAGSIFPGWSKILQEALNRNNETFSTGAALLETRIVFRNWPEPGNLLQSHMGVVDFAPKTWRYVHWLVDPVTGTCWAESENVVAHFDTTNRRAFALPEELNDYMQKQIVKGLTL